VAIGLLLLFTDISGATGLADIRTGSHKKYSRVVIEFNRHVQYQIDKESRGAAITVSARPVQTTAAIGLIEVDSTDACLKSVTRSISKNRLYVRIDLHSPHVELRHFTMTRPFRIVIDIYPSKRKTEPQPATAVMPVAQKTQKLPSGEKEAGSAGLNTAATEKSEKSPKGKIALFTDEVQRNEMAARFDSLSRSAKTKLDEIFSMAGTEQKEPQAPANRKKQNKRLNTSAQTETARGTLDFSFTFLAILGFLLLDIVLISYYITSRKRKSTPLKAKVKQKKPKSVTDTAMKEKRIQKSPQRKSFKTELQQKLVPETFEDPGSDFIASLTSLLDSGSGEIELPTVESDKELDEINGIKQAVKVDSMIASLSEAITKPAEAVQHIPDLDDVLRDLESVSSDSGSIRDMSRNDLVGKDGEDFLNNIRRETFF
jgi:hypothetical protein